MTIERIVDTSLHTDDNDEQQLEKTLRPQNFSDYVGQDQLKKNLKLAITAAQKRGEPIDHVLLFGPPGLGKTTMATVIANEMGANIRITSGPAIERAGDLASILTNLGDGDILFIDEIHRLARSVEEVLYSAMEDYKLDIVIGKGPAARSVRLDLPRFTVIGATTKAGALAAPLRDRFGMTHRLDFYSSEEIGHIIRRAARLLGNKIHDDAADMLALRSRLTPRIANRLLRRVRDYADVNGDGIIDTQITLQAMKLLDIDELGLDNADRRLLNNLLQHYGHQPVGLNTIAALTGDEISTIEDFYEPYLMQIGLLERTPRGRRVTIQGEKHIRNSKNHNEQHQT